MPSIPKLVTPEAVALVVLNRARGALHVHESGQSWVNTRMGTEDIHTDHFSWASIGTVRKALSAAQDKGLIIDTSHHGGRRQWAPSQRAMLERITALMREAEELRKPIADAIPANLRVRVMHGAESYAHISADGVDMDVQLESRAVRVCDSLQRSANEMRERAVAMTRRANIIEQAAVSMVGAEQ